MARRFAGIFFVLGVFLSGSSGAGTVRAAGVIAPVCDFFASDQTSRILFSQSTWSDFRIAMKLRSEKKYRTLVDFSQGDRQRIGDEWVEVPLRGIGRTDLLAEVNEEFVRQDDGSTRYVWKTTLWSGARARPGHELIRRDGWVTEVDADRYSRESEQSYRDQLVVNWLQKIPYCR